MACIIYYDMHMQLFILYHWKLYTLRIVKKMQKYKQSIICKKTLIAQTHIQLCDVCVYVCVPNFTH